MCNFSNRTEPTLSFLNNQAFILQKMKAEHRKHYDPQCSVLERLNLKSPQGHQDQLKSLYP